MYALEKQAGEPRIRRRSHGRVARPRFLQSGRAFRGIWVREGAGPGVGGPGGQARQNTAAGTKSTERGTHNGQNNNKRRTNGRLFSQLATGRLVVLLLTVSCCFWLLFVGWMVYM